MAEKQVLVLDGSQILESLVSVDDETGQMTVPLVPVDADHAVSKSYADSIGTNILPPNGQGALVNDGVGNLSWDAPTVAIDDVTNLQAALDDKADLVHTHETADVIGLDTELAEKASSVHTHLAADVTDLMPLLDVKVDDVEKADPTGGPQPGKLVVLDANGLVPANQTTPAGLQYQGGHTPAGGAFDYPDLEVDNHMYHIVNVPDRGYKIESGDLADHTCYNGDLIIHTMGHWRLIPTGQRPALVTK